MALPLAEAFTARSLGVMWDNYKKTLGTAPYLGRQKFGTRKQDSLDLRFIKGKNGLPVSLKASNFDAQAELRDVGGFSDIQNAMPFYREGYMVTEKEEQEIAKNQDVPGGGSAGGENKNKTADVENAEKITFGNPASNSDAKNSYVI